MKGAYLGPKFSDNQIEAELVACGAKFIRLSENELIETVATALINEKAVGWMQGRMEFGPRALGGRSIIADPRSPVMQKQLNLKVKYRESFRPFAPSVLRENVSEWFEHDTDSPYMLIVADVKNDKRLALTKEQESLFGIDKLNVPNSSVPAITHVDYSARIQTVHVDTNPLYHAVISKFKEKTGCPIVINTSFNIRGEPIICSPTDAFRCFMGTGIDILAVGNFVLYKKQQDQALIENYKDRYELD
jgi:carbamoyltransferase